MKIDSLVENYQFKPFCRIDEENSSRFFKCLCLLTQRSKILRCRNYICLRQLGALCEHKGIALSSFFAIVDQEKVARDDEYVKIPLDTIYKAVEAIRKNKVISNSKICLVNDWEKGNYTREKLNALRGERYTMSLMKLHGILFVLDVSLSSFFEFCEMLQVLIDNNEIAC